MVVHMVKAQLPYTFLSKGNIETLKKKTQRNTVLMGLLTSFLTRGIYYLSN
jgi:hypothetical protein